MEDSATVPPAADCTTKEATFKRCLGLFDSVMVVVGVMIGSGIFIVSAETGVSKKNYLIAPVQISARYAVYLSTAQLVAIGVIVVLAMGNALGVQYGKMIQIAQDAASG